MYLDKSKNMLLSKNNYLVIMCLYMTWELITPIVHFLELVFTTLVSFG